MNTQKLEPHIKPYSTSMDFKMRYLGTNEWVHGECRCTMERRATIATVAKKL